MTIRKRGRKTEVGQCFTAAEFKKLNYDNYYNYIIVITSEIDFVHGQ